MVENNLYKQYLNEQLSDPEFAAMYALSKEKIRLEISLEKLKERIELNQDKRIIIRNLNKITKHIRQIAL